MKLGLVGLTGAGKTTIFNLLTGAADGRANPGRPEAKIGVATVPDQRVDWLAALYRPRRTVYAQIECLDLPGLAPGEGEGRNQFLAAARNTDALVQVVRSFRDEAVPHVLGEIDPARDLELLQTELLLADLEVVEKRIERLRTQKKLTKENLTELGALEKIQPVLAAGGRVATVDLTEEEKTALRGFAFLTERPVLVVVNQDEEQFRHGTYPAAEKLTALSREQGIPVLNLCGKLELEIAQLEPEERAFFLADLNLTESGIARLARAAYNLLGLISFFTVGEDEVKAWTIPAVTTARRAAGKIHSDMEKGFIRAEVVNFQDLARLGSMAKVREHGLFRLEGKEYIVQDGDIITFRFNV